MVDALQEMVSQGVLTPSLRLKDGWGLVFLGDYVDRGPYGMLVLMLLRILIEKNPTDVLTVRGNHENPELWRRGKFEYELSSLSNHLCACKRLSQKYNHNTSALEN